MRHKYADGGYKIMGFFWERLNPDKHYPFTGNFKLKKDQSFEGETEDVFGAATIKGKINDNPGMVVLSFTKEYLPGSTGYANPILWALEFHKGSTLPGWRGFGIIQEPDGTETPWQIACILFTTDR